MTDFVSSIGMCDVCGKSVTHGNITRHHRRCLAAHNLPPDADWRPNDSTNDSTGDNSDNSDDSPTDDRLSGAGAMGQELVMKRHQLEMARLEVQLRQLNDSQAARAGMGAGELAPLLAALQRQGDQMMQFMQAMARPAAPPFDMAAIMRIIAETVKPRGALGGLEELKTIIEVIRPMMPTPAAGLGGIEGIREIIALGRELANGREKEDSVVDVLKAGFEHVGRPLADAYFASKDAAAIPSSLSTTMTQPVQAPGVLPVMMNEETQMKMFVAMLLGAASRSEPPELWVDQVIYHVPEDALKSVVADPIPLLERIDKRVTLHADWFRTLAAAVKEALADENSAELDPSGASRDPNHSEDDATPGG